MEPNEKGWLKSLRNRIFSPSKTSNTLKIHASNVHEFDLVTPTGLMEKRKIYRQGDGTIIVDLEPESKKANKLKRLDGQSTEDYIERAYCEWILNDKPSIVKSWKQPDHIEYHKDGESISAISTNYGLCAKVKSNYHVGSNGWIKEQNLGETFDDVSAIPSLGKILKDIKPNPRVDIAGALEANLKNWMDTNGATVKPNLFYFFLGGLNTLKLLGEQITLHHKIDSETIQDKFHLLLRNGKTPTSLTSLDKELSTYEKSAAKKMHFYKAVNSKKFTSDLENGHEKGLEMIDQLSFN